jgi:NADH:ubiquinone oxidoreductase subunit E
MSTKKTTLQLCMGSACHQYGVYAVLPVLQKLLADHDLETKVVFKGAFCLGPCTHGIVLKVGAQEFLNLNATNLKQRFEDEILPCLQQ